MALKLNIRPEIEKEMNRLLPTAHVRSKTEYINKAIAEMNRKLMREMEIEKLRIHYQNKAAMREERKILREFAAIRYLTETPSNFF